MIWWIVAAVIGAIGVANGILNRLRNKAANERQRWAEQHQKVQQQIQYYNTQIEQKIRLAQGIVDFNTLTKLHFESMKVADHAYHLLTDSRVALNAIGEAIVETAKEKSAMITKKRSSWQISKQQQYEQEIVALKQLRDHLTADKNELKKQRDDFFQQVSTFNARTHSLKIAIRDRCGTKGQDWYYRLESRTDARRLGLPVPENTSGHKHLVEQNQIRSHGTVKWFDSNKGYGFIYPSAGGEVVHVSRKNLSGITSLQNGDNVTFVIMIGDKGPWARDVRKS